MKHTERKKADKLAKQILKQLRACEDKEERTQLEKDLHVAEIDGQYARNFPYLEPYISLYPVKASSPATKDGEQTETASKAAQALRTERPPIWHEIEQAVKEGTPAVIALRERDIRKGETRASKGSKAQDAKTSSSKDGKQKDVKMKDSISKPDEDSDDDSDGGFFEGA